MKSPFFLPNSESDVAADLYHIVPAAPNAAKKTASIALLLGVMNLNLFLLYIFFFFLNGYQFTKLSFKISDAI